MICYVCEHNFETPSGVIAIVACPNCKHNIVTDGSDTKTISQLKQQIINLENSSKSKDDLISKLANDVRIYSLDYNKLTNEFNQQFDKAIAYEKENDKLKKELEYYRNSSSTPGLTDFYDIEEKLKEAQTEINGWCSDYNNLEDELHKLKYDYQDLENKKEEIESDYEKLQEEYAEIIKKYEQLEEQLNSFL